MLGARSKVSVCFMLNWNLEVFLSVSLFCGGRITGEPEEKPSEQGREPTTNSTHIWRQLRKLNLDSIGVEASAPTTAPSLPPILLSEYTFLHGQPLPPLQPFLLATTLKFNQLTLHYKKWIHGYFSIYGACLSLDNPHWQSWVMKTRIFFFLPSLF